MRSLGYISETSTHFAKRVAIIFYVHGPVHRESMSIIVQQDAPIYSLIYFCKLLTLHVTGGKSTHHQEHI